MAEKSGSGASKTIEQLFKEVRGTYTREQLKQTILDLRVRYAERFPLHIASEDLYEYAFDHKLVRRQPNGMYKVY